MFGVAETAGELVAALLVACAATSVARCETAVAVTALAVPVAAAADLPPKKVLNSRTIARVTQLKTIRASSAYCSHAGTSG